jgi:hypothetical protein
MVPCDTPSFVCCCKEVVDFLGIDPVISELVGSILGRSGYQPTCGGT